MALHITTKPVFHYVNTGQFGNTCGRKQVDKKGSNNWWWPNEPKQQDTKIVLCPHYLLRWRNKIKTFHTNNMKLRYNISNYNVSEEFHPARDMGLCSAVTMCRHCRGIYRLCFQGWRVSQASATDDGGDMFWNIADFQRPTWLCVLEDRALHKDRCGNHKNKLRDFSP
jgi:hypothetical protein